MKRLIQTRPNAMMMMTYTDEDNVFIQKHLIVPSHYGPEQFMQLAREINDDLALEAVAELTHVLGDS